MDGTVLLTVTTGVATLVAGQAVVKFVIEPIAALRQTIGAVSLARIEEAQTTSNPGLLSKERNNEASKRLRMLSAELHAHLFKVPRYDLVARVCHLPSRKVVMTAAKNLIGLSNSVFKPSDRIYEQNALRWEKICDSLGISIEDDDRWPRDNTVALRKVS